MEILLLLTVVMNMAVIIVVGWVVSKFIPFTLDVKSLLIFLLANIGLPALVFHSIVSLQVDRDTMLKVLSMLGFSLLIHFSALILFWLFAKPLKKWVPSAGEPAVMIASANTGIIGIPLCMMLFGPEGALYAAAFDMGMAFVLWSVSPLFLGSQKTIQLSTFKNLINMPILSMALGLTVAVTGLTIPPMILDVLGNLGEMTFPLSMIYFGLLLSSSIRSVKGFSLFRLSFPVVGKLIAIPILAWLMIIIFQIPTELAQVIIAQAAMPMAAMVPVIFAKFGGDEDYAVLSSMVAILFSLITIPIMIYFGQIWVLQ